MSSDPTPIACTLSAGDYKNRVSAIADLNAQSLHSVARSALRLELRYSASARQQVEEMVRRERECCAFLGFDIQELGSEIVLTVITPEEAREAAATLFDQFSSKRAAAPGCGCGPQ